MFKSLSRYVVFLSQFDYLYSGNSPLKNPTVKCHVPVLVPVYYILNGFTDASGQSYHRLYTQLHTHPHYASKVKYTST